MNLKNLKKDSNKKIDDEVKAQKVLNTNLLNTISLKVSLTDFNTFQTNINKKTCW